MTETIFSKILRGDIPCHKVYEDEKVYAFLDTGPLSQGHTLLIPKESAVMLHELSDDSAAALGRALPRLCRAVSNATGASAYNVIQNNGSLAHQAVAHVHFHIIPKFSEETGLGIRWNSSPLNPSDGKRLADAIAKELME